MKRILLSIMLLIVSGCAVMPVHEGGAEFRKSKLIADKTHDQIFDGSKLWITRQFGIFRNPIIYENRETGIIIVSGTIPRPLSVVNPLGGGSIGFSLREEVRDGEVLLTCDHFTIIDPPDYSLLTGANFGSEDLLRFRGDMETAQKRLAELTDDLVRFLKNRPVE